MRFVFTKLFYLLFAIGLVPLSLSWGRPWLRWVAFAYDASLSSRRNPCCPAQPATLRHSASHANLEAALPSVRRLKFISKFKTARPDHISLILKDEYPPQMKLSGLREARMQGRSANSASLIYGLTPPKRGRFEFGHTVVRFPSRLKLVLV